MPHCRKLALCFLATGLFAQQPEEVRVSSRAYVPGLPPSDSSMVQIGVVVRDQQGRAIAGLKAQDFQVLDQGKELPIGGAIPVSRAAKQPANIALCFDDYGSTPATLQRAKSIAARFVQDGADEGSLLAVATTFSKLVVDFTTDRAKVKGAIDRVQQQAVPAMAAPAIVAPSRAPSPAIVVANDQSLGQEMVARSILTIVDRFVNEMARMPGNRAVVIFSTGLGGMPDREQDQVIRNALRNGVVINVLDSKNSFTELPSASAEAAYRLVPEMFTIDSAGLGIEAAMADFARATGGLFFHHVSGPLSHGYREVAAVPDASYVLAVRAAGNDQKFHKVKVQLGAPGSYSVEARNGFYPPKGGAESAGSADARVRLDQQVVASKTIAEFPSSVGVQYRKLANGNTSIQVMLHVDIKTLQFAMQNGRHLQKLTLVAAMFDSAGKMVSGKEGLMELALTEAKYNSFLGNGVNLTLNLEAPSGTYRLSTVAQDAAGKVAGSLNAIQIP